MAEGGGSAPALPAEPSAATPLSAREWLVLALACAIATLCSLDRVVMSIAVLPMGEELGYGQATRGLIAAAFSGGYCLGLAPAGFACSARSPASVLTAGLLVWSLAQAATPLAASHSLQWLLAMRALMGVGEAACVPALQVIAAQRVPEAFRSRFWGALCASFSAGSLFAYVLTPELMEAGGWPAAFEVFGAVGVALGAAWGACATEPRARAGGRAAAPPGALSPPPVRAMLAAPPVRALAAAHCASNVFNFFVGSWLPSFFVQAYGLDVRAASGASLAPVAAGTAGAALAGTLADELARRGMPLTTVRRLMQLVAALGPAACLLALALSAGGAEGGALPLEGAQALFVLAVGATNFLAAGYGCAAQDIATRHAALLYGGTSALAALAGAGGQYLTGVVLESTGNEWAPLFALTAAVEVAGGLVFALWWRSDRLFE